ncbi:ABC transporter permease [Rhizobium sp. BG4]|uniref:ABC transporter permease n=1 Tax=Rhizobium sp. BG4 TaxID=2613770 RepID=UPI00193E3D24|nr:ABC transporter permease [Rhizobium sp. BG4]QRM42295.1 ABC transporter permease [Rhizobium sp. BG4]
MQPAQGQQFGYYVGSHFRVVAALLIREMATRFGSKPGGYIWAILDPAAYIIFLTVIFGAIAHKPALGTSFPLFFATGYIGFQFYSAVVTYVNGAVKSNKALLSYPNVAAVDPVFARFLLQLGTTSAVAAVILGTISLFLKTPLVLDWAAILEASLLACLLGLGAALFNNVMFLRFPIYEQIFGIVNRPLFMVAGVFFLPDLIPHPFREMLLINPLCHVLMRFRSGFYSEYDPGSLDMPYLYSFTACWLFAGMLTFTGYKHVLRKE